MDWITDPHAWAALATLTILEVVLGVDNLVFLSVLSGRLPLDEQLKARRVGLVLALVGRVVLLLSLTWIMRLTEPLFRAFGEEISGRDLILLLGGLFLLVKATHEIHATVEGRVEHGTTKGKATFGSVLFQILLLDVVFSLDSVITAVGMADDVGVMITAVLLAMIFMMLTVEAIARFIDEHPTVKMLALSFLLLVGVALVADGLDFHIERGYVYFAMAFSGFVEFLNLKMRARKAGSA